jgi:AcrR family transcriptional regulator
MEAPVPRAKLETRIRRDQIAEATLALVAEQGLREISVAAVARKVGIAPSALYRHYPGKDAILDAVLDRIRERMHGLVAGVADGPGDAVDALHRLVGVHTALVSENRGLFPVLVSDAFQSGSPARRRRVYDVMGGYLDRVAALARRGQREGSIRRDVPPRTLAIMFLGIVQPPAMLSVLSGGSFDPRRPVREAWTLFEQTLRSAAARRPAPRAARARRSGDSR